MEATPIFDWPFPGGGEPPNGPLQIGDAVTAIEERLAVLKLLVGTPAEAAEPAPGQLLVVDGTSHPAYKAATGDVTVNSAGVTTIGEEKVLAAKIAALAVEASKLAANAVETAKIAGLAVTTAKLAELAVTAQKLAAEAVETGKIKARAVTGAKIALETITGELIANGTIADSKLAKPFMTGGVTEAGGVAFGTFFTVVRTGVGIYEITLKVELAEAGVLVPWCVLKGGFIYTEQQTSKKVWKIARFKGKNAEETENGPFDFFVKIP